MAVKMCYVCDEPIQKSEPRTYLGDLAMHDYCDPDITGKTCDVDNCAWRWTIHAGEHVE